MYLNQFSVRVIGGKEQSGGYVEMEHGKTYRLGLRNDRAVRCDARVEIDGKHVGTWRVNDHSGITLERPAHDQAQFTFYRLGTNEAEQAQLQAGDPNLGLVKVTFTPERVPDVKPLREYDAVMVNDWATSVPVADAACGRRSLSLDSNATTSSGSLGIASASCYSGGGTGLSGHSDQTFHTTTPVDPDLAQQTVVHLRLVARTESGVARPLTAYSTPVPPAVR